MNLKAVANHAELCFLSSEGCGASSYENKYFIYQSITEWNDEASGSDPNERPLGLA